jgi:hypothetical protein
MVIGSGAESPFDFVEDDRPLSRTGLVVVVSHATTGATEFLEELGRSLHFPSWYGVNWNALLDCLCDLTWVAEHRVTLWHERVPRGFDDMLPNYLGVLRTAVCQWRRSSAHELRVVFRGRDRERVLEALSRDRYG